MELRLNEKEIKKALRLPVIQRVSNTDYSMDKLWSEIMINFFSECINVDINDIGACIE